MRKTLLLLAAALFAAGFPDPAAADSLPENSKVFARILSQLNLDEEQVYVGFVTSQVVPSDKTRTIWLIPEILAREEGTPSCLGGYVLLADTKNGRIVSRCHYPQMWDSESGAYSLREIGIDTLGYRLSADGLTFGIRSSRRIGSRASHCDESSTGLFVCRGDSLQSVFQYTDLECQTDECQSEEWEHVRTDRRLMPLAGMSDGFYDLALLTEKATLKNDDLDSTSVRTYPPRVFVYAGNCYKEVESSTTGIFRVEGSGSSENFCGNNYYFGRSIPEVYPLIRDEQNKDDWEILLSELPGGNRFYSASYDDGNDSAGNILDISYEYITPEYLVIKISSPRKTLNNVSDRYQTEFYILQQTQDYTMTGHGTFTFTSTLIDP